MKRLIILMSLLLSAPVYSAELDNTEQKMQLDHYLEKMNQRDLDAKYEREQQLTYYTQQYNPQDTAAALKQRALDDLVYIEGGRYEMGDVTGKWDVYSNSKPAHWVSVNGFWMSKHLITLNDYQAYLMWNEKIKHYPIQNNEDEDPRNNITDKTQQEILYWLKYQAYQKNNPDKILPAFMYWNEANFYCQWLGEQTGLPFALPTEAQWEYAARNKGQSVKYATNNGELNLGENVPMREDLQKYITKTYNENLGYIPTRDAEYQPIGLYPPTPLGLYDMTYGGWEWMNDYYAERYYQFSPEDNPQGAKPFIWHSQRGIDWRERINYQWSGGFFGTTVTRNRDLVRFWGFPHGYTARCVVNIASPTLSNQ